MVHPPSHFLDPPLLVGLGLEGPGLVGLWLVGLWLVGLGLEGPGLVGLWLVLWLVGLEPVGGYMARASMARAKASS